MDPSQYIYGKCKYNLDTICQCQEYTSDIGSECNLCKHKKGWHEKIYFQSKNYLTNDYTSHSMKSQLAPKVSSENNKKCLFFMINLILHSLTFLLIFLEITITK